MRIALVCSLPGLMGICWFAFHINNRLLILGFSNSIWTFSEFSNSLIEILKMFNYIHSLIESNCCRFPSKLLIIISLWNSFSISLYLSKIWKPGFELKLLLRYFLVKTSCFTFSLICEVIPWTLKKWRSKQKFCSILATLIL